MSFADILNQEQKKIEQNSGGDRVKFPETKHKRLFFDSNETSICMQILPTANLYGAFWAPVRKIFLNARKQDGTQWKMNFLLDADFNEGSLLDQKVKEWGEKEMIPNGFGGQQTARRFYMVNAVRVFQQGENWVQERDAQGNLVVRVFEMPQSAYADLIGKLQDPKFKTSQSELSFMDVNGAALLEVKKPPKNTQGPKFYSVEVFPHIKLPPLGLGWESQLEDLAAQSVPTERLENGAGLIQAFVDVMEGRKPNQGNESPQAGQAPAPQANPYAAPQPNAFTPGQAPAPQAQAQPAPTPTPTPTQMPDVNAGLANLPDAGAMNTAPQPTPAPVTPAQPQTNAFTPGQAPVAPPTQAAPTVPTQAAPAQPAQPNIPQHATNGNGLPDINAMLDEELENL
jgi:hypothetical protein